MQVLEQATDQRRTMRIGSSGIALLASVLIVAAVVAIAAIMGGDSRAAAWWPFVVLVVSVGLIVTLISIVKVHPFIALIIAAMATGWMSRTNSLPPVPGDPQIRAHWTRAVELTAAEFGSTAGKITIVIALAAVIGMCLLESGAADKVVRRFLAVFGEKRAGLALLASTYIVSIPIFFDTIFMLLLPLAKALRLRTGKDYVLYIMAICCAGVITHGLVIPHPGPVAMAQSLQIDPGITILVGLTLGLIPAAVGWQFAKWINRRIDVPLIETPGAPLRELEELMDRPESDLPGFWTSILPVILPVVLIGMASVAAAFLRKDLPRTSAWAEFVGNRNVALLIGTGVGIALLMKQKRLGLEEVARRIGPPLETAGMIILITAAGGAFGTMLRYAGVGDAIRDAASGRAVNLILLSWLVATVIRVAQGSATVAMLTTAAMMRPLIGPELPYHPVYIFMAIGYGGTGISWMNDSGFWVVSRLGGLTTKETLRTWTLLLTVISLAGLATAWILSVLMPLKQVSL